MKKSYENEREAWYAEFFEETKDAPSILQNEIDDFMGWLLLSLFLIIFIGIPIAICKG